LFTGLNYRSEVLFVHDYMNASLYHTPVKKMMLNKFTSTNNVTITNTQNTSTFFMIFISPPLIQSNNDPVRANPYAASDAKELYNASSSIITSDKIVVAVEPNDNHSQYRACS